MISKEPDRPLRLEIVPLEGTLADKLDALKTWFGWSDEAAIQVGRTIRALQRTAARRAK